MSTFTGFSEEDLKRIKSGEIGTNSDMNTTVPEIKPSDIKKPTKVALKTTKLVYKYKSPILMNQNSDEAIDNIQFDKCKLSLRTPTSPTDDVIINNNDNDDMDNHNYKLNNGNITNDQTDSKESVSPLEQTIDNSVTDNRRDSTIITPDIVRAVENYTEDDLVTHKVKLEELQLKQKIMEEQNKKRKEMLAKALADRTKQTAEEVVRLEKIKKELQVLDGQFSQDVAVLRKKIDQACLSYADAEKNYLKVEKEFLQAKISLQKEKEKKELLTEHLCALITHNETRKAQKLETLMLELASDRKSDINNVSITTDDEKPVIIDGVDERTGKIVEINTET